MKWQEAALRRGLDVLTVVTLVLVIVKATVWTARYCRAACTPSASDAASAVAEGAASVAAALQRNGPASP